MNVGVDQSGHEGAVAEIDDFCAGRALNRNSYRDNAIALHQNFAGLEQTSVLDIQQTGGVKNDGARRRLRLGSGECG
jgi:hypothetical protein